MISVPTTLVYPLVVLGAVSYVLRSAASHDDQKEKYSFHNNCLRKSPDSGRGSLRVLGLASGV